MASNEIIVRNSISGPSNWIQNPRDTFFDMPEMLSALAEVVDSRTDLKNLCLVNKAFDSEFSRILYRHLKFTVNQSLSQRLLRLLQTAKLSATRTLSFEKNVNGGQGRDVDFQMLRPIVGQLLRKTPGLRSFCWSHSSGVDILHLINDATGPSDFPLSKLRTISIFSPSLPPPNQYPVPGRLRMPWNLTNLTMLVVDNMGYRHPLPSQDFGQWFSDRVNDMVQVLSSCPKLAYLQLSVAEDCLEENPRFSKFFPSICEKYHERGSSPLQLKALNLGLGMLLVSEYENGEAAYLRHLTRTQDLMMLQIESNGVAIMNAWLENEGKEVMQMAWGTVSPENTPSLVTLYIDQLDQAGCKHLLSEEMPALLRNMHLVIKAKEVLGTDDEDGEETGSDDSDFEFSSVTDLFSEELERPLQTRRLSIHIDRWVLQTKAPRSWLNQEALDLTLSVLDTFGTALIVTVISAFTGLATRCFLDDNSIKRLALYLLVTPDQHRHLMLSVNYYHGTILQSLVAVGKTCRQLRVFTLVFCLIDPDNVLVRRRRSLWRVDRPAEEGRADVEIVLVDEQWL